MGRWIEATRWTPSGEPGVFDGLITEDWTQGRGAFGGVVAAGALRAAATLVPADRPARSVLVSFVAPARPGAVRCHCRVLRHGRSITTISAEVVQDDHVCTTLQIAFGIERPTSINRPAPPHPGLPPATGTPMPYLPGITPAFTQHLEYRWTGGCFPFSGGDDPSVQGWIHLREPDEADAGQILALLDAWPPPIFGILDRPAPGSTVSWHVDFVGPLPDLAHGEACFFSSKTRWSQGGYVDFEGELYGPDGDLLAVSRQLLAEFTGNAAGNVENP